MDKSTDHLLAIPKFPSKLCRSTSIAIGLPGVHDDVINPDEDISYISLKDIIWSSSHQFSINQDWNNDFDSSNIAIKNQLVRSAASAYLQSTAILATRNQSCFVTFWEKVFIYKMWKF
ncbi:hypothetical protein ACFE04_004616 [Oxalis oulophora]